MTTNLLLYKQKLHSQSGQDGIIEHIFKVLGIKTGHFVEFGAWDGVYLSNCRKLFEEGWSGVFIESHPERFPKLQENYLNEPRIVCLNQQIAINGENSYDQTLRRIGCAKPVTFLSIDVDGADLEIFESIEKYLPLAVCLEGGKAAHPMDPRMPVNRIASIGQSLNVIKEVAEKKGYKILCAYQDTFLIREDQFGKFSVSTDLIDLYIEGYLAQEYLLIPKYVRRLQRFSRKNAILDYILEKTNYSTYSSDDQWLQEHRPAITSLLKSLPSALFEIPRPQ